MSLVRVKKVDKQIASDAVLIWAISSSLGLSFYRLANKPKTTAKLLKLREWSFEIIFDFFCLLFQLWTLAKSRYIRWRNAINGSVSEVSGRNQTETISSPNLYLLDMPDKLQKHSKENRKKTKLSNITPGIFPVLTFLSLAPFLLVLVLTRKYLRPTLSMEVLKLDTERAPANKQKEQQTNMF